MAFWISADHIHFHSNHFLVIMSSRCQAFFHHLKNFCSINNVVVQIIQNSGLIATKITVFCFCIISKSFSQSSLEIAGVSARLFIVSTKLSICIKSDFSISFI